MSTLDADASEAAAAAQDTPVVPETSVDETEVSVLADAEVAASNRAVEPANDATEGDDAPKKKGRKRKASVTEDEKATGDESTANGDAAEPAEQAAEKPQAKKPAKKAKASPAPKKKMGRPRKIVKEDSETEDEGDKEMNKRVDALPEEIKSKFGSIVWAKMAGYPYWPGLIADPRRLESSLQARAMKDLDTKYMVCFYETKNFAPMLFKNVESWDDKTHSYREGHPAKDAKAPKRRSQLMAAIDEADRDAALSIDERMGGLLKVIEVVAEPTPDEDDDDELPATKRKPGRPAGSKNKPKAGKAAAATAAKAKGGRKKTADAEEANGDEEASPETPGDDEVAEPALSKDEIKAKVASRKAPSKKKTATPEEKSAAAAAKKAAKASVSTKGEKAELDSKRKKEIELVVPRKSVKSADIREATDEAARKKSGPREKPKDKGDYKVGNLTNFAGKMNRLHANESSKNNDELIQMLTQFFDEKTVYRSDMERSGVAAVVAVLRKSANPTVSQTASAVRKHLIKVLVNDVQNEAPVSKKNKANGEAEAKPSKKQKTADASPDQSSSPVEAVATEDVEEKQGAPAETPVEKKESPLTKDKPEPVASEPSTAPETQPSEPVAEEEPKKIEEKVEEPAKEALKEDAKPIETKPASPPQTDSSPVSSAPKSDPSGDKSRLKSIEMLKKSLVSIADKSAEIAREIEAQVFDRFNESNDEYIACARSITFGLKKNAMVRERLASGSLTVLELVYTHDEILKDA